MMNPLSDDLNHILSHTEGLWEELRGLRIFITGGTGFFGCWLLESLLWADQQLSLNVRAVVLTRNTEAFDEESPTGHPSRRGSVSGDVRSFSFPEGEFSHIIHAATESSSNLNQEDPSSMLDIIVSGTRRTLDFAVRCGPGNFF